MSQPEFVTVRVKTGLRYKETRQIPAAEFIALYTDYKQTLRDIGHHFDISVFNVRYIAEQLQLPSKSFYCQFRRDGYSLDIDAVKRLVEDERMDIQSAADALGVSYYLVKKAIRDNGLKVKNGHKRRRAIRCRPCIPPPGSEKKPCEFIAVCQQLEPDGLPLRCEELLVDELPITEYERDSAPSIGYGVIPFCNLMR